MAHDPSWFHDATYHGPDTGFGPAVRTELYDEPTAPARPRSSVPEMSPEHTPPVLYVPCDRTPLDGEVAIQTRVMKNGRVALLAYTALDRLFAYCGPTQPWVLVYTAALDELDRVAPFDVLLLDVAVPDHARTTTGGTR